MLTDRYINFLLEEKSASGEFTEVTWSTVGTYKGFIQPVSGNETFRDGKAGESVTHRLYTAVSVPCAYGQRVTQSGVSYTVIYSSQVNGISAVGHHKEVLLGEFK